MDQPPDRDLLLHYSQPARDWQSEALPIGNGRLGAMCFGDPARERLQINESSLWTGDEQDTGAYQNLGDIFFEFASDPVTGYRRWLDLSSAVAGVTFRAGGTRLRREYFASRQDNVLIARMVCDQPSAVSFSLSFVDAHGAGSVAVDDRIISAGKLPNGLMYETQIVLMHEGGTMTADGAVLRIDKADACTVLVAARTNYSNDHSRQWRGAPPHDAVLRDLALAGRNCIQDLRDAHETDYRSLFERVELRLGASPADVIALPTDARLARYATGAPDPGLEALLFQFGRYLLIASSRDALPANLQGLWNASNNPPWRCDYHSNINVQMNYWPAEVCNLSECALPFFNYVRSQLPARRAATRKYYAEEIPPEKGSRQVVRGWTLQTENNIFGAGSFKWNPPASAWYALHFWEHYTFTQDVAFLREVAYPLMKEVCEFWEDHLVALPDGRLVSPDGWSPEHGPEEAGVSYDQEIVWNLLENFLIASSVLDVDREYRATVEQLLRRLHKPVVGRWGQLQEWMEDRDDPHDTHRHVSHLFSLHPGNQISMTRTPALAAAARVSLEARGDESTGWAMAWRVNLWARLRDGDRAYRLVRRFLHPVSAGPDVHYERGGGVYSNLLCAHPPFQIDGNFGAASGITEMLLQSHAGEIDLLPALPAAWSRGSFTGLRARGGVEVDASWDNGRSSTVTLRAAPGTTVRLRERDRTWKLMIPSTGTLMFDPRSARI